jgi:hypothetical protein
MSMSGSGPILGDMSEWSDSFDHGLIPEIINLVRDAWARITKPKAAELETRITNRLCHQIQELNSFKRLPLRVTCECPLPSHTGSALGRLDLQFTSRSFSTQAYFSFECKRLYARFASNPYPVSLAPDYVTDGMMRYMTGQYAPTQDHGGMIGYVLSGPAQRAIKIVEKSIQRECTALGMKPPGELAQSLVCPTDTNARQTVHVRNGRPFFLHHLFLAAGGLLGRISSGNEPSKSARASRRSGAVAKGTP